MNKNLLRKTSGQPEVIVSMTSFPARIKIVHQTLRSLIDQIVKPDRIVLCLARDEFPGGRDDLPSELLLAIDQGVELLWAERNLKPHKKYFYTMRKYPDAVVITVDDDKIYPQSFVGELVASYRRFPKCVSAFRAHLMTFGPDGELLPYLKWKNSCSYFINRPNLALFAVGAGGILYPPHLLPENLFDEDGLLSTTLNGDDIWLKIMEVANRIPVVIPSAAGDRAVTIDGSQESALYNANKDGNDGMIRAAWNYFSDAFGGSVSEIIREGRLTPVPEDIDHAISECHGVQQLLSVQKSRANKAISDYHTVQEQLKQEKDRIAKLTTDMAQCVQEKNVLARTKEATAAEVAELREQLEWAAAERAELAKCKAAAEAEAARQREQLERAAAERAELAKGKATAEAEVARQREQFDQAVAKCAELAKGKAAVEAEAARQREQLERAAAERVELAKTKAVAEAEVARQREQLERAAAERTELAKGKAAVEAEAARRRAQCVKLEDGNRTLSDRLAELTKKANRAASDYAKMKNWYQRVQQNYEKLSKAKLGRLTLRYWRVKDAVKCRFRKIFPDFEPTISVIIPTCRPNGYIDQAIRSVVGQSYPSKKIKIFLCVNGPDNEWFVTLKKRYSKERQIAVLYTPKPGLNSGRNLGIGETRQDLFTFLDDDDALTPDYISCLSRVFRNPHVNIAVGKTNDYDADLRQGSTDTYINKSLGKIGSGVVSDYGKAGAALSNLCGKIFRTAFFKSHGFFPLDEEEKRSEDIVFWAEHFGALDGLIYVEDVAEKDAYCRRVHQDSLSRPTVQSAYQYWVSDGIRIIERMGRILLDENNSAVHKLFVLGKIKAQVSMIKRFYDGLDEEGRNRAFEEICASPCLFLDKSLFSPRRAIAFCHNFPPFVDASSFVASKRLLEINQREGAPLDWHVFAQNMRTIRTSDQDYVRYFVDLTTTERQYYGGSFAFVPKGQLAYAEAAFKWADGQHAEVIYSRSMFVGGHIAASMYKKAHPEVKWYAEFSDPPAYGVDNKPRACNGTPTWFDIEQMVYEGADVIIFTNSQQRDFMLSYNPRKELNRRVLSKSLVMHHPVISHEYCGVKRFDYALDEKLINIGFFGTFYANRKADDLLSLLTNPKVVLHIFTSKPEDMADLVAKYEGRLRVNPQISHFEFLNLGSRMDYLVLTDTEFSGKLNPFLPSKYADYRVTGAKIIAKVQPGSVLSQIDDSRLIKVSSFSSVFSNGLSKP